MTTSIHDKSCLYNHESYVIVNIIPVSSNIIINITRIYWIFMLFFLIKVKRRWDDDVVFKNCAKGIEERKKDQVFINDAIRSEFHKKFMEKYIK